MTKCFDIEEIDQEICFAEIEELPKKIQIDEEFNMPDHIDDQDFFIHYCPQLGTYTILGLDKQLVALELDNVFFYYDEALYAVLKVIKFFGDLR